MRPEYWCMLLPVTIAVVLNIGGGILDELYHVPLLRKRCLRIGETLMVLQFGCWLMWWTMVILYGEKLFP